MINAPDTWTFWDRWMHKLFYCPTFWNLKPAFKCPVCGDTYRCYWEGNDIEGYGIDICDWCAKEIRILEED